MGKHTPNSTDASAARHLETGRPGRQAKTSRSRVAREGSALVAHGPVGDPVVTARNLSKVYGRGDNAVTALDSVDVHIARSRFTAIMGPSGSGKSTLMHCLAGLDSVTSGTIHLDGEEISAMSQRRLTKLRRRRIGFIFQSFNLVPTLTAEENITLPLDIARVRVDRERFDRVVETIGLRDRLTHRPAELSGGQVQRVACARALVGSPAVVFADEPTGNLDSRSTDQVLSILRSSVDEMGQSVVMVTHEPDAAAWADTVIFLRDGRVVAEMNQPDRDRVLDALHELGSPEGPHIGVGDIQQEVDEAWAQPQRTAPTGIRQPSQAGKSTGKEWSDEDSRADRPSTDPWGIG
ncbi:ABC transporter ATP-binding protein [Actinomyces howellii]|uniref:Lipoprotein-releasing system ATP-binding protein LolD n=1 Tax=Actinomyces howellii TaxID=52771 RepID=A0A3S4R0X2_9ACTO|nr:ABC transporter ATP-binding protein [Actinomyces howellii]VEG28109.1 Lipoprotein-releasing system ATP-binding protein LolD [Actinomyces howellii]